MEDYSRLFEDDDFVVEHLFSTKPCHAERGCMQPNSASLVQKRFRVKPGMTVVASLKWRWWQVLDDGGLSRRTKLCHAEKSLSC